MITLKLDFKIFFSVLAVYKGTQTPYILLDRLY